MPDRPYNGTLPRGKVLFWYTGAKRTGVKKIVPLFPADRRLVSPFFGRGDCEFAFAARTGQGVVGYDLDEALVAFWYSLFSYPNEFADLLELELGFAPRLGISQGDWIAWWNGERERMLETHSPVLRGVLFLMTQQGSFGGKPQAGPVETDGTNSCRNLHKTQPKIYRNFLPPAKMKIQYGDAFDTIPRHRDDFLYLDPPFVGIEELHRTAKDGFDHARLRDLLYFHRGGFVMSYRGNEESLQLYRHFRIEPIDRHMPGFRGSRKTPRKEVLIFGDARCR